MFFVMIVGQIDHALNFIRLRYVPSYFTIDILHDE